MHRQRICERLRKARLWASASTETWIVFKGLPINHFGKLAGRKGANLGLWMVAKVLPGKHSQQVAFCLYLAIHTPCVPPSVFDFATMGDLKNLRVFHRPKLLSAFQLQNQYGHMKGSSLNNFEIFFLTEELLSRKRFLIAVIKSSSKSSSTK